MPIGKLYRRNQAFMNVVPASTATAVIPTGRTIQRILIALGTRLRADASHPYWSGYDYPDGVTTAAQKEEYRKKFVRLLAFNAGKVKMVRLRGNNKTIFEATGPQCGKLMRYRGTTDSNKFLVIDFTELRGRDKLDMAVGALDTTQLATLNLEVEIGDYAVEPTLVAYLQESAPQSAAVKPVMAKVLRYPWSSNVAGMLPIQAIPHGTNGGAVIKRAHIQSEMNNVQSVTLKEDSIVIFEGDADVIRFTQRQYGNVPQRGWLTLDFTVDGNQQDALDTRAARSMELLLQLSGADHGEILVEYYDTLQNL